MAAGLQGIKSLHEKPKLLHKPFLVTSINSKLNGADDHVIQSETITEMTFDDEDDRALHQNIYNVSIKCCAFLPKMVELYGLF